jgi:hypothetical protein
LKEINRVADHAEQGAELLLDQFKGRPRILALLLSYLDPVQELEDAIWDVLTRRLIQNAEGEQLDFLGNLVGQPRLALEDAEYRIYLIARIRINRSHGHADDVIEVLTLVEHAEFLFHDRGGASIEIEYTEVPSTSVLVLLDLARAAKAAGVQLAINFPSLLDGFIFGNSSDPSTLEPGENGFGDAQGADVGGYLSSWQT